MVTPPPYNFHRLCSNISDKANNAADNSTDFVIIAHRTESERLLLDPANCTALQRQDRFDENLPSDQVPPTSASESPALALFHSHPHRPCSLLVAALPSSPPSALAAAQCTARALAPRGLEGSAASGGGGGGAHFSRAGRAAGRGDRSAPVRSGDDFYPRAEPDPHPSRPPARQRTKPRHFG